MLLGLTSIALAASPTTPFDMGPLQVLPLDPLDVAVVDQQLVVVNADGAQVLTPTGWQDAGLPGGRALLAIDGGVLVCGESGVTRFIDAPEVVSERPCLDLAQAGEHVWVLSTDGVYQLADDVRVELPKRPTVLGGSAQRTWLEGNELVVDGTPRLVFPGTTDVVSFPTPMGEDWLLVHPARQLFGRLGDEGLEAAWRLPFAARALTVGDRDGDGTPTVIVVGEQAWMEITYRPSAPEVRPAPAPIPAPPAPSSITTPRRLWQPPETIDVLTLPVPLFAGLRSDPEYDALFIGGFGLATGRGIANSEVPLTLSPIATGGIERGANRVRSYFGADSAPLFIFQQLDNQFIHLAMGTVGVTLGSDRLRIGPFVSAGLIGAAVGVRAVVTPFESRIGKLSGLEARLTYFAPYTAHASLAYVNAFPLGRRATDDRRPDVRRSLCRRFGVALGGAGGFSSTEAAWELVGRSADYQFSGSPAASMSCEAGTAATGWALAADTAPFFFYRVPVDNGGRDKRLFHAGSFTVGPYAGTDRFRVGPVVTAGVWTLGAGVRAVATPFKTRQGVWHGLELRATALFPSAPAFQGMAMWHVWIDPKASAPKPLTPNPLAIPSAEVP